MMHYYESWAVHMVELLILITSCIKSYIKLIQRFFLMKVPMNEESIWNTRRWHVYRNCDIRCNFSCVILFLI